MSKGTFFCMLTLLLLLPVASLFSQQVSKDELFGKLGGTYVSEFLNTAGAVYYGESITFKNAADSFFYWHVKNGSGKGRYKLMNDTLVLHFSGSVSLPGNVHVKPFETERKDSCSLNIQTYYDSVGHATHLNGVTIEVSNRAGKIIYSKSLYNSNVRVAFSEFPITVNGYCLGFKPVSLFLENECRYDIVMNLIDSERSVLDHGETVKYLINVIDRYSFELREIFYLDKNISGNKPVKKFMFSSFKRM